MRTLIVSDLHFGSTSRADVLRTSHAQQALLAALDGVDRLVLLGDVLELRHGPRRGALEAARPFFEALGEQMDGREIVLVAGNHDHAIVDGWLQRRTEEREAPPLGLEQRIAPAEASPMAGRLAAWAAGAGGGTGTRFEVAYPGLWVRRDVYAMHGHYLDAHITVPTMERMGMAAMGRLMRRGHASIASVEDYEALSAPVYAWIDAVAAQGATGTALNGTATVRIWRALGGDSSHSAATRLRNGLRPWGGLSNGLGPWNGLPSWKGLPSWNGLPPWKSLPPWKGLRPSPGRPRTALARTLRRTALRRGFPLAVAAINRAGLGPVSADISGPRLRAAGLAAMGEVASRLGLRDCHLIFGHTHRAGPLPSDAADEWLARNGVRLMNAGCWTYDSGWLASTPPAKSPYWPGGCVIVEEEGPPRLVRLLTDSPRAQLAPTRPLA
jgi:predicted phosphodiesterase